LEIVNNRDKSRVDLIARIGENCKSRNKTIQVENISVRDNSNDLAAQQTARRGESINILGPKSRNKQILDKTPMFNSDGGSGSNKKMGSLDIKNSMSKTAQKGKFGINLDILKKVIINKEKILLNIFDKKKKPNHHKIPSFHFVSKDRNMQVYLDRQEKKRKLSVDYNFK
jgi:hypothetical protein